MAEITNVTNPALWEELGKLEDMYNPIDVVVPAVLEGRRPDQIDKESDSSLLRQYAWKVHNNFIIGITRGAREGKWSEDEGNVAIQLGAAQSREFKDNLQSLVSRPKVTRRPQPQRARDINVGPHPDGPNYY